MTETPQQDRVDTEHLRDYSALRRSVTDRKIAGVAGGLGRHLNIDPTILRVAFVVLVFFGGAGLLLYGALWLLVPEEGKDEAVIATSGSNRNIVLAVAASIAALLVVGDAWGGIGFPWPLAVLGLVLLVVLLNRDKPVSSPSPPQGPATPQGSPGDSGTTTLPAGPYAAGYLPPVYPVPQPVQQPAAPATDRGPRLFWPTVALLAVVLGALGLYDVGPGSVGDAAYAAVALTVVGAMLVVGARFGRPGGLILLGMAAALALLLTSVAAEPRFAGERQLTAMPTSAAQVDDRYSIPAGALHLDLSGITDVEELDGRSIEVQANAGELLVTLPDGVDAAVEADIATAGEVTVLGESRGGFGVSRQTTVDGGEDVPRIDLELDLVVGSIEVRQ